MYFDTYESETHIKAKEKLFDLISQQKVKLIDNEGKTIPVYLKKLKTEFLHMESMVVGYGSDVLYSNPSSPCKSFITQPLCSQEGVYGEIKNLPCQECILRNVNHNELNGSSKYASYRPDIAYGLFGKHRVWIEIYHKSKSSYGKVLFCKDKGIKLLEVKAKDVLELSEGDSLVVDVLNDKLDNCITNTLQDKLDIIIESVGNYVKNNNGYISNKDFYEIIDDHELNSFDRYYVRRKVIDIIKLIKLENYSLDIQTYLGLSSKTHGYILPSRLHNIEKEIEIMHLNVKIDCNKIIRKWRDRIENEKWVLYRDYKQEIKDALPKGHKSKLNEYIKFKDEYIVKTVREMRMMDNFPFKDDLLEYNINTQLIIDPEYFLSIIK